MSKSEQVTIQRSPHDRKNPYSMILNSLAQDNCLTLAARGLMLYLLSMPANWVIHPRHLAESLDCGKNQIYSLLNQLIEQGYAKKTQIKGEKGRFGGVIYEFFEEKLPVEQRDHRGEKAIQKKSTVSRNPDTENTVSRNPDTEKGTLINKYHTNYPSLVNDVIDKAQLCVDESMTFRHEKGLMKRPDKLGDWSQSLTDQQLTSLQWLQSQAIDSPKETLTWWAKNHSMERLQEVHAEAISRKPISIGKYMYKLLEAKSSVSSSAQIKTNKALAEAVKAERWSALKVFAKYATYQIGAETCQIDFSMDCDQFARYIHEKAKIHGYTPQPQLQNTPPSPLKPPTIETSTPGSTNVPPPHLEERYKACSAVAVKEIRAAMSQRAKPRLTNDKEKIVFDPQGEAFELRYDNPNFERLFAEAWVKLELPFEGGIFEPVKHILESEAVLK